MKESEVEITLLKGFGGSQKGWKKFQKRPLHQKKVRSTDTRVPTVSFKDSEAPVSPKVNKIAARNENRTLVKTQ